VPDAVAAIPVRADVPAEIGRCDYVPVIDEVPPAGTMEDGELLARRAERRYTRTRADFRPVAVPLARA
jgi:hypothetical protein